MTDTMRVVLDTNVVLSALLLSRGRLEPLRQAWQAARFTPLVSTATARELIAVLAYPRFKLSPPEQEELLADYLPYSTVIPSPRRKPALPDCRDPHDLPFLGLATVGKAAYLVTGDKDLHAIRERTSFRIVSPADFIEILFAS